MLFSGVRVAHDHLHPAASEHRRQRHQINPSLRRPRGERVPTVVEPKRCQLGARQRAPVRGVARIQVLPRRRYPLLAERPGYSDMKPGTAGRFFLSHVSSCGWLFRLH